MVNGAEKEEENNNAIIVRVAVGTTNPSKLRAVEQALKRVVTRDTNNNDPAIDVVGVDVSSGVPDQPMGDDETKLGAKNRAENAWNAYQQKHSKEPHLAVGLEGGLEKIKESDNNNNNTNNNNNYHLYCMAWMAVYGKRQQPEIMDLFGGSATVEEEGTTGTATEDTVINNKNNDEEEPIIFSCSKTALFALPPLISKLVIEDNMELGKADDLVFRRANSGRGGGTVGILTGNHIDRSEYYEHALILAFIPWIRPDVYPTGFKC